MNEPLLPEWSEDAAALLADWPLLEPDTHAVEAVLAEAHRVRRMPVRYRWMGLVAAAVVLLSFLYLAYRQTERQYPQSDLLLTEKAATTVPLSWDVPEVAGMMYRVQQMEARWNGQQVLLGVEYIPASWQSVSETRNP